MLGSFESKLVEDYVSGLEKWDPVDFGYSEEEMSKLEQQMSPRQEIAEKYDFPMFFCTFEGGYLLDGHYLVIRAPSKDDAARLMCSQFGTQWSLAYTEEEWLNRIPQTLMKFLGEF